jgi:hypothetical protein
MLSIPGRRLLLPLLAILLLLPTGCIAGDPAPSTALPAVTAALPTTEPTIAAVRTRVPRPTLVRSAVPAAVGPLTLTDGLTTLDAYRITFSAIITDSSGSPRRSALELRVAADGSRRTETTAADGSALTLFELAAGTYRLSDAACLLISAVEAAALLPDPALVVAGFTAADLLETTVDADGAAVERLQVTQPLLPAAPAADLAGSAAALRAVDGGYLLAYAGTYSNGVAGISWDYRLDQINDTAPIPLPEPCSTAAAAPSSPAATAPAGSPTRTAVPAATVTPAIVSAALLPDDAANLTRLGTLTLLTSRRSVAALSAGYLQTLSGQGWRAAAPREQAGSTILSFSRDGRRITVTLAREDDLTTVMISQP